MTDQLLAPIESLQRRFDNLPEFIAYLQKTDRLESWHRDVLGCIPIRLRTHFRHLCIAYRSPHELEYVAWAARNLLELAVWAKYATTSTENAKRLHSDHLIDLAELQAGTLALGLQNSPSQPELETLKNQGDWLRHAKAELGFREDEKH